MIHDAIKPTDWHHSIAPTRALLQTVEEPLAVLWALFQANDIALAALEPTVDVVDFAPFAQLAVSAVEPKPAQVSPVPRRTHIHSAGTSPLPTAGPPSLSALASTAQGGVTGVTVSNLARADNTPVFALPGRKSATAEVATAGANHSPVQSSPSAANQSTAQPGVHLSMPLNPALAWQGDPHAIAQSATPHVQENQTSRPSAVITDTGVDSSVSVETMVRLATLTETLLRLPDPKGPVVSGGAQLPGVRSHPFAVPHASQTQSVGPPLTVGVPGQADPAPLLAFSEGHADQTLVSQSLVPATRIASPPMLAEGLPRASVADGWLTEPNTAAATSSSQPDGWTLAQLINDVLAEEARRHGVDLS